MYRFDAPLWRYDGAGGWHFVTVPGDVSDDIAARTAGARRGFGAVRVKVTIGATSWATSVFRDAKRGAYLLPVKQQVRVAEHLADGDPVPVTLELTDT